MVMEMSMKSEICPTLREIICRRDQCSRQAFNIGQNLDSRADSFHENEDAIYNSFGNYDAWSLDHEDGATIANENIDSEDPTFESHQVLLRHDTLN